MSIRLLEYQQPSIRNWHTNQLAMFLYFQHLDIQIAAKSVSLNINSTGIFG